MRDETLEYLTETASINAYRQNKKEERDRVCADRSVIAAAKKNEPTMVDPRVTVTVGRFLLLLSLPSDNLQHELQR